MPRSGLERKLVLGVLLLFLVPTLAVGAILLVLYQRDVLDDPHALAFTVLVGFVAMMAYLGLMTHSIGRGLVSTLQDIQRGTELMATVYPDYRLDVRTDDELEAVADEINRMADRVQAARRGLEAAVAEATRELALERGKLSAVLQELEEGVLVATLDGQVTLANPKAQQLLGAAPGAILGRSLFDFVDRDTVAHHLERAQAGQVSPGRFTLHPPGGAVLQAAMSPLVEDAGGAGGFILALRDVSQPLRRDEERRQLLGKALRDMRGPLASIRSLAESLRDDPALSAGPARRFLEAIHAEALRLSAMVGGPGVPALAGLAGAPWQLEEVAVEDLLAMSLRRLGPERGRVELAAAEGAGELRIRAEPAALSAAVALLARGLILAGASAGSVVVRAARHGPLAIIDVTTPVAVPVDRLERLLDEAVALGPATHLTVRSIVQRHAGEAWHFAPEGRAGIRATLPVSEGGAGPAGAGPSLAPGAAFVGVGMRSGAGDSRPVSRPEFYDFSFFDQLAPSAAEREQRLDEATCVVLDVETTGLHPDGGDRIVSLAGVKVRAGAVKRAETFDALVSPGRPIPAASIRFHGITDAMVAEAPPPDVVLPAFLRFADNAVLVGHEVWFDLAFLGREVRRLGLPALTATRAVLDTRLLSQVVHGAAGEHDLDALARRLGVGVEGRHSALGDALATAEVLVRLVALLRKRGIVTVGAALDAARTLRRREPA